MHVTKEKAKAYHLDHEKWRRACYRAAAADYSKMNQACKKVASLLQDGREMRITAPGGTEVECALGGRSAYPNDGVIDDEDLRNERYLTFIPAGDVTVAPVESSADGRVVSNNPLRYSGTEIRRVALTFEDGRVTSFEVGKGGGTLKEHYEASRGDRDRFAFLRIGVNPRAVYGYTIDRIVAGAVSVGIGGNELIGGKNDSAFSIGMTLRGATVAVDGREIVRAGILQL